MTDYLCSICGTKPCTNPSFCRACRIADRRVRPKPSAQTLRALQLMDPAVTLDRAWHAIQDARRREWLATKPDWSE